MDMVYKEGRCSLKTTKPCFDEPGEFFSGFDRSNAVCCAPVSYLQGWTYEPATAEGAAWSSSRLSSTRYGSRGYMVLPLSQRQVSLSIHGLTLVLNS
jgi:hypothetical protein